MLRYLSISVVLVTFTAGVALRAAAKPHAVPASKTRETWTNDNLERLSKVPGLISVVGPAVAEVVRDAEAPTPQSQTQDPAWYAAQAAALNARLEAEQADLHGFTQALEDARELKSTTGGMNLAEDDIGITPEATVEILQNRLSETQSELDALEDLARKNNIAPGILRGRRHGTAGEGPGDHY